MQDFFLHAPVGQFGFAVFGIALAALLGLGLGFLFLHRARLIEDTPTSRLRSAAQGYVELEGHVRLLDGPPIIAPLSATRCCWWRYQIEEKQTTNRNGRRETRWVKVESGTSDGLFRLDDGTGECVVDPEGAKVIPSRKWTWYGNSRRPSVGPKAGGGFLRSMFGSYRYREELLEVGTLIYALGRFHTSGGGVAADGLQREVRELLVKWKHDPKMKALLDVNKDGQLDEAEWEAARRMAERKVLEAQASAPAPPDVDILKKPRDRRPYLLSAKSQDELIREKRIKGWLGLAVFLAGVGLCAWALQLRGLI